LHSLSPDGFEIRHVIAFLAHLEHNVCRNKLILVYPFAELPVHVLNRRAFLSIAIVDAIAYGNAPAGLKSRI
jgi:hypothetical protein